MYHDSVSNRLCQFLLTYQIYKTEDTIISWRIYIHTHSLYPVSYIIIRLPSRSVRTIFSNSWLFVVWSRAGSSNKSLAGWSCCLDPSEDRLNIDPINGNYLYYCVIIIIITVLFYYYYQVIIIFLFYKIITCTSTYRRSRPNRLTLRHTTAPLLHAVVFYR